MSKILILPDIHGRDFWMEPCNHINDFDKVVFLGDYHDPYPNQVSQELSLKRLRDNLVPLVEQYKDKIVCLFGNHDANYLIGECSDRMDHGHKIIITELIERLPIQLVYQIDNYLFSHSGVLPLWIEENNLKLEELNNYSLGHPALMQISPMRGGWDKCGSCIWGDVREYDSAYHYEGIYQIFGHTQLQSEIIEKDYACLDCRKAFILDTDTKLLTKY